MTDRAAQLIADLALTPHPEGGHFREIHRSRQHVVPGDGRGRRAALTTIYFLLREAEVSRWHRVLSDEVWHVYEGDALELLTAPHDFSAVTRARLGPSSAGAVPVGVVCAGDWQAARALGDYVLAGCSVGPGFDFADFTLLRGDASALARLRARQPEFESLL